MNVMERGGKRRKERIVEGWDGRYTVLIQMTTVPFSAVALIVPLCRVVMISQISRLSAHKGNAAR